MKRRAKFVREIQVEDMSGDSVAMVSIAIYKHENGGMFGVDSSFIEQVLDDDEPILDPFGDHESNDVCYLDE